MAKGKKLCPTCGEDRMYFGYNIWCVTCDEHKIMIYSRNILRSNKKKIDLGLIQVRKGSR